MKNKMYKMFNKIVLEKVQLHRKQMNLDCQISPKYKSQIAPRIIQKISAALEREIRHR